MVWLERTGTQSSSHFVSCVSISLSRDLSSFVLGKMDSLTNDVSFHASEARRLLDLILGWINDGAVSVGAGREVSASWQQHTNMWHIIFLNPIKNKVKTTTTTTTHDELNRYVSDHCNVWKQQQQKLHHHVEILSRARNWRADEQRTEIINEKKTKNSLVNT